MFKKLENGFTYIEVKNKTASAKVALQGAHIFEYKCKDKKDMLWLSPSSYFEEGKAIRGGVPICWPRFGVLDKSMPAHGFSRAAMFTFVALKEIDEDTTELILRLCDTKESREIWDYKFELDVVFSIADTLTIEMITKNLDTKEFMITQALHTYFSVSHIDDVVISGLEEKVYIDTLTGTTQVQKALVKVNAEIDRVYHGIDTEIILADKERKIRLNAVGSASAVIWNPWIEKGSNMSGMRPDTYKEFVCIETANAFDDFRVIAPNKSHTLSVTLHSD
ncbi:D-hexose-6-phosphate mutarotase [Sulfurimonas sp. SAG-AH-194-L11]|nr:D-hexose-6-phosphate mutarotase [Sulfurimonas sp. SAG-AH-194-L11]MDF1877766.1 D-hexose-6-phosphate mutarotase [Sulfurimonas sp. SAG-AH-194-L11]